MQQFHAQPVCVTLEHAVAKPMPRKVGAVRRLQRRKGRRYQDPVLFVLDIDCLTEPVADGIIAPGGSLVLPAVSKPGVPAAICGTLKSKHWICNDIDPRGRGRPVALENRDIFAPILGESPKAIEKLKLTGADRRSLRSWQEPWRFAVLAGRESVRIPRPWKLARTSPRRTYNTPVPQPAARAGVPATAARAT